jgi:hypothetical protein
VVDLIMTIIGSVVLCLLMALAMYATKRTERARCAAIVAGRICSGHWPKRDLATRIQDPCDYCDRVAECLDYIEPPKDASSKESK